MEDFTVIGCKEVTAYVFLQLQLQILSDYNVSEKIDPGKLEAFCYILSYRLFYDLN